MVPVSVEQMAATEGLTAITVSPAFKNLVKILACMFYSEQCPPAWWVDAADPKKEEDPDLAIYQQEKKAAQLQREAKRKAQVGPHPTYSCNNAPVIMCVGAVQAPVISLHSCTTTNS